MTSDERVRVTVHGPEDVSLDLAPDDIHDLSGPIEEVRSLIASSSDEMAGRRRFEVTVDGWVLQVTVAATARLELIDRASRGTGASAAAESRLKLRAQIPGRVVRIWVEPGQAVDKGQRLLAIEAMKMENEVRAPRAGIVELVEAALGVSVELGDELVVLA